MICPFCEFECQEMAHDSLKNPNPNFLYWNCDRHIHEVLVVARHDDHTGGYYAYSYLVYHNNIEYRVEGWKVPTETFWRIKLVNRKIDPNDEKIVVKLPYLPANITPDNIQKKIATLITFS
jgi:hypothetical protein